MTHAIKQAIFDVSRSLEIPVLLLALLALAAVIIEIGAFGVELRARHRRHFPSLAAAAKAARYAVDKNERDDAAAELKPIAWSPAMTGTLAAITDHAGLPGADTRLAKALADFDFDSQRRLARTRLLVRVGPALGLMGTLIPLSPALNGLAEGKLDQLSQNLRIAFSVTVLGLLIGAVAFILSLYRDRIYGQDLSDLEYVAAVLTDETAPGTPPTRSPVEPESTEGSAADPPGTATDPRTTASETGGTPPPLPPVSAYSPSQAPPGAPTEASS